MPLKWTVGGGGRDMVDRRARVVQAADGARGTKHCLPLLTESSQNL